MTLPLPHWFILHLGHPQGLLSHSHIPPETQGEMKLPQTPSAADTHARMQKTAFSPGGLSLTGGDSAVASDPPLTFTHIHTHVQICINKKKNTVLIPKNAAGPEWMFHSTSLLAQFGLFQSFPWASRLARQIYCTLPFFPVLFPVVAVTRRAHTNHSECEKGEAVAGSVTSTVVVWHQQSTAVKLLYFP